VTLLVGLIVLAPIVEIVATAYLWWLYLSDEGRSWILRMLTVGATAQLFASTYIAILGVEYFRSDDVRFPAELLALAILVLQAGPPYLALEVARRQHARL